MAGPAYNGGRGVERVMSAQSQSGVSEKSEKRRSGFFSLGRKDKDKARVAADVDDQGVSIDYTLCFTAYINPSSHHH